MLSHSHRNAGYDRETRTRVLRDVESLLHSRGVAQGKCRAVTGDGRGRSRNNGRKDTPEEDPEEEAEEDKNSLQMEEAATALVLLKRKLLHRFRSPDPMSELTGNEDMDTFSDTNTGHDDTNTENDEPNIGNDTCSDEAQTVSSREAVLIFTHIVLAISPIETLLYCQTHGRVCRWCFSCHSCCFCCCFFVFVFVFFI